MELNPSTPVAATPPQPPLPATREGRLEQIQRQITEAYGRHQDWITFFREVLGTEGIVRRMFPTAEELAAFEKTDEYEAIQQMLTKLRERSGDTAENEPTRVITVRLPKSLHESLKSEAHMHQTSMNQLCISKLLQLIDKGLVPNG
jgi:predicted HicB family RNase H-like nuclease